MKRVIALIAVLALFCVLFAGCAAPAPAEAEKPAEAPAAEEKAEPAEPAEPAEEPEEAPAGEPIKIGLYTPLTGGSAAAGDVAEKGVRLAIEQINEAGGIQGSMLELIVYDDQGTPEGATKAVTRLVDVDNVSAIIGSFLSANVLATAEITEEAKVLHLGLGTSASFTNQGFKYLYRGTILGTLVDATFVDVMCKDMGAKKVAIISAETEYGQTGLASVTGLLEKYDGVELVESQTMQATDTDFTAQVTKVISSGADAVVVYTTSDTGALIVTQLRRSGYMGYIYGDVSVVQNDIINIAGEAGNGIIAAAAYTVPTAPELGANQMQIDFLTAYVDTYGEMPTYDTAYRTYDSMMLIAETLKSVDDVNDRDAISEAFRNIKGYIGIGGEFDFTNGTGDGLSSSNKYMITNGVVKAFDKAVLEQEYSIS